MEDVYVIKVKTKPPLSSLYPSERRYSASTVGGLALVHFGLGALALLLGILAQSLQGPIMSLACLVPFATGLLAWRRWYIDRNIGIFFYGSLFSMVAAILCLAATVFDIAAVTEGGVSSPWTLENILAAPEEVMRTGEDPRNVSSNQESLLEIVNNYENIQNIFNDTQQQHQTASGYLKTGTKDAPGYNADDDLKQEASMIYERKLDENYTDGSSDMFGNDVISFWHTGPGGSDHTRLLLNINVLVACLLEIFWSALSAKIALRGMNNHLTEPGYQGNVVSASKDLRPGQRTKPRAPRPDILNHAHKHSGSLQSLNSLQSIQSSGPRLPLPESSREFRERVERFLTNQAAHRIVEGSCS
ncbi:uncharacterized protein LOC112494080 [Cephus cinctus]|uniref:Uncharacterized protein LOC112494080 n=1 Tax=Cephus cinctus TaxID=211228 RepID=A0AAJ7VZH4_CEPCN|nr:uncharacterized protein LOC112494080 [Cephus cinctus]